MSLSSSTIKKAQKLVDEGGILQDPNDKNHYEVKGVFEVFYDVHILPDGSLKCTCAGFAITKNKTKLGDCKHCEAVRIFRGVKVVSV